MAARGGDPDLIRLLVARGLDVNAADDHSVTPLCDVVWRRKPQAVVALLEAGADPNKHGRHTRHLVGAIGANEPIDIVQMLLAAGADANEQPVLHYAIWSNRTDIVKVLLAAGANANQKNSDGSTALHSAVRNGRVDIVHVLLTAGADATIIDEDGNTPLDLARTRSSAIVKMLQQPAATKPVPNHN